MTDDIEEVKALIESSRELLARFEFLLNPHEELYAETMQTMNERAEQQIQIIRILLS